MITRRMRRVIAFIAAVVLLATPSVGIQAADNAKADPQDFANIVLFAYFRDETNKDYFNQPSPKDGTKTSAQKIIEYYDGTSGRAFGNYMSTISGGQLRVHNLFPQYDQATGRVSVVELPFQKTDAQNGNIDYNIIKHIAGQSIDVGSDTIDYDGDGVIDNLTVILVGEGVNNTTTIPSLYPHTAWYPGDSSIGGKKVYTYNMLNTDRIEIDETGVICHEFLHSLGYPDLYTRDGSIPVYNWDIMGVSSKYVGTPLAYMKMYFSGWESLKTLDQNQTGVEISASSLNGENQAYIIEAPGNPYEVFVVERRTKGDYADADSLDAAIGGSGLIVYRVDTTVDGLSNYFGKTGVYVFRPQPGQPGYDENSQTNTLNNAFLSEESGRVSIGSADMNKGLEDGALTFSDGTNSGIVISNVSSSADGKMTFDLQIPNAADYDRWQDTGFNSDGAYSSVALLQIDGRQIAGGYNRYGNSLQLYEYKDGAWTSYGQPLTVGTGIATARLFSLGSELGVGLTDGNGELKISKYDGQTWKDLASWEGVQSFAIEPASDGGSAHLVYVQNNEKAYYASVFPDQITTPQLYAQGFLGDPQVMITDSEVYVAVRYATNDAIDVYRMENGVASVIASPGAVNAYSVTAYNDELYFASGTTTELSVKKYDSTDNTWKVYASASTDSYLPRMVVAQGNLYILTMNASSVSSDGLRAYEVSEGQIVQEGLKIDVSGDGDYSLTATNDTLFAAYSVSDKAYIRQKTTVNSLMSLTIEPPVKTTYVEGETVSYEGLKVYGNYVKGQKELSSGEYSVTGYDTDTTGEKNATVTFGGVSNTFSYIVFQNAAAQPSVVSSVTMSGIDEPRPGQTPVTQVHVSEEGIDQAQIEWKPGVAGGSFTYGVAYTAEITLKTKSGYVFDTDPKVSVDGVSAVKVFRPQDDTLMVTITYPEIAVPDITATPGNLVLEVGQSEQIVIQDETGSELTWNNSDDTVISVSDSAVVLQRLAGNSGTLMVTALKEGSAQITVENMYNKQVVIPVEVRAVQSGGGADGGTTGEDGVEKPQEQEPSQDAQTGTDNVTDSDQPAGVETGDGTTLFALIILLLLSTSAGLLVLWKVKKSRQ